MSSVKYDIMVSPVLMCRMRESTILYRPILDQVQAIAWPSDITKERAIAFIKFLFRKRHMENTDPIEYTDLAYVYFLEKLGSKYRQIIKPLLDHGILQSTNYYRPGYDDDEGNYIKGQCLSYRINPELMDDEMITVTYKGEKRRQRCRDEVTMHSKRILRQLRIPDMNSREIIKFVKTTLTDARIRTMVRVDDEITAKYVTLKGNSYPILKEKINLRSKSLIQDGKYCHVEHLDIYLKRKRRHLTHAYCDQLLRIKHRNVYADRNETNLRLDSNLTNLKSGYLSMLTIDGQRLSNIDLKNSQFRFFVYLLESAERQILLGSKFSNFPASKFSLVEEPKITDSKEEKKEGEEMETLLSILFSDYCISKEHSSPSLTADYKRFKQLVKTGQLYEYIQQLHWKENGTEITRDEAKRLMFKLAFSSHRYNPPGKQILRKHFPSIIGLIDEFKKHCIVRYKSEGLPAAEARDKGNASFAILLQRIESRVFIDKILTACYKRKLKVLSKHDSILCRQSDRHIVTKLICRALNQLFGKWTYSLDIDGKVFEISPKRNTRMQRLMQTFVSTLFGMEYRANAPPKLRDLHTPGQVAMSYKAKLVPTNAYNARAPRTGYADMKPLKSQRLEKLRKRFWKG